MEQNKADIKLGRFLSLVLRHRPEEAGITVDSHGWADVKKLLAGIKRTGRPINMETLERIVRENNKQRYSFNRNHTKIRANQGHSFPVDLDLEEVEPPPILYHGTATCFLDSIYRQGILKMERQYVHLSGDVETALNVGQRHGNPIVLTIDAEAMFETGIPFYCSANGVWLCDYVAPEYFISKHGGE